MKMAAAPAMATHSWRYLLIAAALLAPPVHASDDALAQSAQAQAHARTAQGVSLAETLLFQTRHLDNVHAPAVLLYAFHKEGRLEAGFDDEVTLARRAGNATSVRFLSGAHQHPTPEIDDAEGNPVLLAFLEHDIAAMHRLTGGASSYFRKRIRLALAEAAQVRPRRFVYLGQPIDGREVLIEPYRDDPMHARFEQFTAKRYAFLISASVPGGIYQLRTVVPDRSGAGRKPARPGTQQLSERPLAAADAGAGDALIAETLTLVGSRPGQR